MLARPSWPRRSPAAADFCCGRHSAWPPAWRPSARSLPRDRLSSGPGKATRGWSAGLPCWPGGSPPASCSRRTSQPLLTAARLIFLTAGVALLAVLCYVLLMAFAEAVGGPAPAA